MEFHDDVRVVDCTESKAIVRSTIYDDGDEEEIVANIFRVIL